MHLLFDHFFSAVHGPVRTQRTGDKAELVRAALDRASAAADDAVMIGDRAEDIRAARAHGIRAVAVGWGYGAHDELQDARPDYFAPAVSDLIAYATQVACR